MLYILHIKSANNFITVHYLQKAETEDIRTNNTIKKGKEKKKKTMLLKILIVLLLSYSNSQDDR